MSATAWFTCIAVYGAWVLVASGVALVLIAWDKRQARLHRWRVPEATLHLWELLGGWPGAIWARRRFRHKTTKRTYVWKARAMVALHLVVVVIVIALLTNRSG